MTVVQISNDNPPLRAVACSVIHASWAHGSETSDGFSTCDYVAAGLGPRVICASELTSGQKRSCYNVCNFN